jgi:hypothetical protein
MMLIFTNYTYLCMRATKLCKYLDEFNRSKNNDIEPKHENKCTPSIAITVKLLVVSRYSLPTAAEHKHTLTVSNYS